MKIAESTSVLYLSEGLTMIEEKEPIGSGGWTWKRVFTIAPGVMEMETYFYEYSLHYLSIITPTTK